MEYRGFKIINEYKEKGPGAWRAYEIDNPECVCDGATLLDLHLSISDVIEERNDKQASKAIKEALAKSIQHEELKRHFTLMMSAMDEFMSKEELRDVDTAEEYVAAAKFAKTLGVTVRTRDVEQWIETELNKK